MFLFFQGAGVSNKLMQQPYETWKLNKDNINKYEIVRQVLTKLNEQKETYFRERREILKRVIEYDSFSSCWPNDQLKAKGLVSEIRKVVNTKDSFTRMAQERTAERNAQYEGVVKSV